MDEKSAKQRINKLRAEIKSLERTRDAYTKDMAISDRDDNKFDTKSGPFERMMKGSAARKASSGIVDRGRTLARLESSKNRSETSAKYRLAKAKAEKKRAKGSKTGRMLDRLEMMDAPRTPFLTKNKKKGKK